MNAIDKGIVPTLRHLDDDFVKKLLHPAGLMNDMVQLFGVPDPILVLFKALLLQTNTP